MRRLLGCGVAMAIALGAAGCSKGDSGDQAKYCALARSVESRVDPLTFSGPPADVRREIANARQSLIQLHDVAPKPVRDDLATLLDAFGEYTDAARDAGWDPGKVDPDVVDRFTTRVQRAGAAVDRFDADRCGLRRSTTTTVPQP